MVGPGEGTVSVLRSRLSHGHGGKVVSANTVDSPCGPLRISLGLAHSFLSLTSGCSFKISVAAGKLLVRESVSLLASVSVGGPTVYRLAVAACRSRLSGGVRPRTPISSGHFGALSALSGTKLFTKVILVPMLPFVRSGRGGVLRVIGRTTSSKTEFVCPCFKIALHRGRQRCCCDGLSSVFPGVGCLERCGSMCNRDCRYIMPGRRRLRLLFRRGYGGCKVLCHVSSVVRRCRATCSLGRLSLFSFVSR